MSDKDSNRSADSAQAAVIAAKAAATAAEVARDVAARAAETAASVAALASKTTESVVILGTDIKYIKDDLSEIKRQMESHYVSRDEFMPVKNIVFGLVGILGVATIGAILKLVLL